MLGTTTYFTPPDADYPQARLVLNPMTLGLIPVLIFSAGSTPLGGDDLVGPTSAWEQKCRDAGMVARSTKTGELLDSGTPTAPGAGGGSDE